MVPRAAQRAVEAAVGRLGLAGRPLVVACSGGIDSTVLLDALHRDGRARLAVGHVNHGLRGEASGRDEAFVRELARERGLPFRVRRVTPGSLREGVASRERPTLQEAARRLRYAALAEMQPEPEGRIATAHSLDDQAETVLMRLLRGTGPPGLGGIPPASGAVVRPLLAVSRAEVEAHAAAWGLAWREDASNASPAYTRNRLRPWVQALADEFNPRLLRAIGDLAEAQREEQAWIAGLVEREADARLLNVDGDWIIEGKDWEAMPDALARRLARELLVRAGAGRDVSRVHLDRVVGFLRTGRDGAGLELPGGKVLARRGGSFRLGAKLRG